MCHGQVIHGALLVKGGACTDCRRASDRLYQVKDNPGGEFRTLLLCPECLLARAASGSE